MAARQQPMLLQQQLTMRSRPMHATAKMAEGAAAEGEAVAGVATIKGVTARRGTRRWAAVKREEESGRK